jgi:mRNA interferase MazF
MAGFVKGDVVVVPFPFSDLSRSKRRPALVVSALAGDDVILCQITSRMIRDQYAMAVTGDDFEAGALQVERNIRPNRIFTADSRIVLYRAGMLKPAKLGEVIDRIVDIIRA